MAGMLKSHDGQVFLEGIKPALEGVHYRLGRKHS